MKKGTFGTAKTLLASALIIGATAGGFWGTMNLAVAAETDRVVMIPTAYPAAVGTQPVVQSQLSASESVARPVYTIVDNDLEYYRDIQPTANDISREAAAEIGANALVDVFGIDLNGKEIEMTYQPAEDGLRAKWEGRWLYDGQKKKPGDLSVASYSFSIDAVSGEIHSVGHNRFLPTSDKPSFDTNLVAGSEDYSTLAKKAALEHGAIYSTVKTVEYGGQGSINNDPIIWYDLVGTDGELARVTFSRYDKALVKVEYDGGVKWEVLLMADMDQKQARGEQRAKEYFETYPDADTYYDEENQWTISRELIEGAEAAEAE